MAFESLQRWLAERAGFYRELPDYLRGLRKTAIQEIVYGESVIATAFAVYTYVYSISLASVLLFFAGSFVLAGYHIWRAEHLRLVPKFEHLGARFEQKTTTDPTEQRRYVQLRLRSINDAEIEQCEGHLLQVMRWSDEENDWIETELNQHLHLHWSYGGPHPITFHPGMEERLNLLWVNNRTQISLETWPQVMAIAAINALGAYKFDVHVTGRNCPPIKIRLRLQLTQPWDALTVEQI